MAIQRVEIQMSTRTPSISKKHIPLSINMKKGQRAYYVNKEENTIPITPLSRLLSLAYFYVAKMQKRPGITLREFCEENLISPRYLRSIIQFNFLSPGLKKKIMDGWLPSTISVGALLNSRIPLLWEEQEKYIR